MKAKLFAALICAAFAVGFGAGGYMGLASVWGHAKGWQETRSWQPVPARIIHADLETQRGDDSTTYRVVAVYRYTFGGRSYEATRVGIADTFDNVTDWHHEQHKRLDAARISGEPVTAWVNPEQPQQAVLDRELRWSMIVFMIPFATLFPLVSLGAFVGLVYILKTPVAKIEEPEKAAANAAEIRSNAVNEQRGAWFFAIFWGLIAFPLSFVFISKSFGHDLIWLMVLLFPAVGVYLIVRAARLTSSYRRFGETLITLTPAQPALGARTSVRVRFEKPPPEGDFTVTLACEKVDRRGDSTTRTVVWRDERIERAVASLLTASFAPPATLPPTEPEADIHHRWLVRLEFPEGSNAQREFEVVFSKAVPGMVMDSAAIAEPESR